MTIIFLSFNVWIQVSVLDYFIGFVDCVYQVSDLVLWVRGFRLILVCDVFILDKVLRKDKTVV